MAQMPTAFYSANDLGTDHYRTTTIPNKLNVPIELHYVFLETWRAWDAVRRLIAGTRDRRVRKSGKCDAASPIRSSEDDIQAAGMALHRAVVECLKHTTVVVVAMASILCPREFCFPLGSSYNDVSAEKVGAVRDALGAAVDAAMVAIRAHADPATFAYEALQWNAVISAVAALTPAPVVAAAAAADDRVTKNDNAILDAIRLSATPPPAKKAKI